MKKAAGVLVAAVILLVGLPGSASADLAGTQDFLVVFSGAEGSPGRVIATGAFTGVGTVVTPQGQPPSGFPAVLTFPQGTLVLAITPTENDLRLDPVSCIFSGPIFGTYEIASGTGQFAGASGGGTFQGRVFALVGRGDEGQCGDEPIFVTQVIRNPGTISIPSAAGA